MTRNEILREQLVKVNEQEGRSNQRGSGINKHNLKSLFFAEVLIKDTATMDQKILFWISLWLHLASNYAVKMLLILLRVASNFVGVHI